MPRIESFGTREYQAARYVAYGVEWEAVLLPGAEEVAIVIRPVGADIPEVPNAVVVPKGSVASEEDLAFVLARPEANEVMCTIADFYRWATEGREHERTTLDDFDFEAFRRDVDGTRLKVSSPGRFGFSSVTLRR